MVNRNIDSFGHDEMATPELKLVQNTGGDDAKSAGAHPGDFYFPLTGEIIGGATGLDVIIADVIKTRTYWGRDDIGEDPPQCASVNDRYHKSMDGQDCLKCEKRADMPGMMDKAERRSKCLAGYNILSYPVRRIKSSNAHQGVRDQRQAFPRFEHRTSPQ